MIAVEEQVAWLTAGDQIVLEKYAAHLLYSKEGTFGYDLLIRTTNLHGALPEHANRQVLLLTMLSRFRMCFLPWPGLKHRPLFMSGGIPTAAFL